MFFGMVYQRHIIYNQNTNLSEQEFTMANLTVKLIRTDKELRDMRVDNDNLRTANEALLTYAEPKSCLKAIQKTPLPKMKDSK
jgi:hypothetical protein